MEALKTTITRLPHAPGVYLFYDRSKTVIYVGKAINLARRVRQYFQSTRSHSVKTTRLVSDIRAIKTIRVASEFDALLLEAKLIRQYLPKYNVVSRDDKSPLYVALTRSESLPRILFVRRAEVPELTKPKGNVVYGPFQSAHAIRALLTYMRQSIPFCMQKTRNGKPCFYAHIGLCNPCPSEIVSFKGTKRQMAMRLYRSNIAKINALFAGRAGYVIRIFEREMKRYAKSLEFEKAHAFKIRLDALYALSQKRYDPAIFLEQGVDSVFEHELDDLQTKLTQFFPSLDRLARIECFDISHLQGTHTVGSMVVLSYGQPDTRQYRRFRIRRRGKPSDTASMKEVLQRRLKHDVWPMPDLLVVDGGKPQVQAAQSVLSSYALAIPVIGLAKRFEEIIINTHGTYTILRLPLSGSALKVVQRVRDEAHRFAVSYHRMLRSRMS